MTTTNTRLADLTIAPASQTVATHYGDIFTNLTPETFETMLIKWTAKTECLTRASLVNYLNLFSHLGFEASVPLAELPAGHIRKIPAISNSRLTRFKAKLQGEVIRYPERCLVFGQAFHAVTLEHAPSGDPVWNLRPSEWAAIQQMRDAYIGDFGGFLAGQPKFKRLTYEKPRVWKDKETGLPCKAQFDIACRKTVFDVKTTSAWSEERFIELLDVYDYDRQAAFYLDGSRAEWFYFVGVQKRPPYAVHIVPFHRDSDFIEKGRKKYRYLLRRFVEAGERI